MQLTLLFLANFCKNCDYFSSMPYDTRLQRSVCLKFNGKLTEICRDDENKCGQEGKYYVEKDKIPQTIPPCSSCKHYEPSFGRCNLFKSTHEMTGLTHLEYAESCRVSEYKCGKYGKYFTPYKIG